jgi:DNA-binding transcriptional MerR regulator
MDFSIGELSRRTQVKVPTVRYYEQIGLMPSPPRSESKQRRYQEADAGRLNFIRHARELGFEIGAIRELLELSTHPDRSCEDADRIARHLLEEVDRRIGRLRALRTELTRMISECGHGRVGQCRVIQVLADHDLCRAERH